MLVRKTLQRLHGMAVEVVVFVQGYFMLFLIVGLSVVDRGCRPDH